jgi:type IV pilus assembly protein PilE
MGRQAQKFKGGRSMKKNRGFTLIELMITIAIVAIIAAIAIPSYTDYVRKGRRSQAVSELGRLQMTLERWRADNASYGCASPCVGNGTYPVASATLDYYDIAISGASTTGYTLTATPKGAQSSDACANFIITYSNGTPVKSTSTGAERCW